MVSFFRAIFDAAGCPCFQPLFGRPWGHHPLADFTRVIYRRGRSTARGLLAQSRPRSRARSRAAARLVASSRA